MSKLKNYDVLDLTKLVLSIMIVAIHTSLFPNILYPWLRLAVPLFFIISSFLLFSKVNNVSLTEKDIVVKNYIIRQLKLYLFWFIILLPLTVIIRKEWIIGGGGHTYKIILTILKNTLFSSTFIASWFIAASIWATLIIYKVSKKVNNKVLFVVFLLINFICCLVSSYSPLFTNLNFINKIANIYSILLPSPIFSFPVALIWIFIGKMFADKKIDYKIKNKKIFFLLLITFSILLFVEWKYVIYLTSFNFNDCYFSLIPLCFLIFKLLLNIDIKLKNSKVLRKISTIIYPLHASVAYVIAYFAKNFITDSTLLSIFNFFITLLICLIASFVISKLEKIKIFGILKYSH